MVTDNAAGTAAAGAVVINRQVPPSPGERNGGPRRFSITGDGGRWALEGVGRRLPLLFADLASALAYARRDSDAAEATIELRVDGVYVCVHQPRGWPRRICGARVPA
jgi:hypothetical protein